MTDFRYHYSYERNSINRESNLKAFSIAAASIAFIFTWIAAWVTHVLVCIKAAAWVLLVIGIVVPPIGIVHGVGVWFGFFL